MPELEPITREEKLLDGQDLEPITRREMFIKRIYDKTQTIPEPITREEYFLKKAGEGSGGDVTIEQLNVTENGTYSESGKAYSPVVVNVPIPENAYLLNEVEDLPKDIATFDDGVSLPMPSLKVGIEPQQDLHGYDSPWVGGAGKNKLPLSEVNTTIYGITITTQKDSNGNIISYTVNGTAEQLVQLTITSVFTLPVGTWTLSGCNSSVGTNARITNSQKTIIQYGSQDFVTVTTTEDLNDSFRIRIENGAILTNAKFYPMIEVGSTVTAFEPYSNICPISGHTEANIVVSPTTDAEDGQTYTIQFKDGDNPLTVYGGSLDVVSGSYLDCDSTIQLSSIDSFSSDTVNSNGYIRYNCIVSDKAQNFNIMCDKIKVTNTTVGSDASSELISGASTNNRLYFTIDSTRLTGDLSTTSGRNQALKTLLQTDDIQLVYELATPITYQLTPTQVKSLLGQNNIWANTGDVIEGQYFSKEE